MKNSSENISEVIEERLAEVHMSADEALALLADQARGDLGEFINDFGGIDISQVRKEGKTKLIKRWKTKTVTINGKQEDKEIHTEDLELYDAQAAIDKVLRIHGKYKDLGTSDNPVRVLIEYADHNGDASAPTSGANENQE